MATITRNATLADMRELLEAQRARSLDVVVPALAVRSENGVLVVKGAEKELTDEGVTDVDGRYRPTEVCDEGLASKLGVPIGYLRRLRADRVDLFDANVNGLLHGRKVKGRLVAGQFEETLPAVGPDDRKFLVRALRGDDGEPGVARAFLSDRYKVVDDLDVLVAALGGVRDAGVDARVSGCDLTDRRMYVRIEAPEVRALAPQLLKDYRSPFSGQSGADNPVVFGGLEITNSEVGCGAFSIVPRLVIQVCTNGMVVKKDALRAVHLGGRQEEGVIDWSHDTQKKILAVVTAKARDAVRTFLSPGYLERVIAETTEKARHRVSEPETAVKVVAKKLAFDEDTRKGVFDHFIRGGDTTTGGLMNAVTSFAQSVSDADLAHELEMLAMDVLDVCPTQASTPAR